MSEYELGLMISEHMGTLNQLTEFWLTISFAVVVAVNYAPANLEKRYFSLLFYGYLAASLVLYCGRINWMYVVYTLAKRMIESGFTPPNHPFFGSVAGAGIFLLMFFGTISVLYYIRKVALSNAEKNT